MKCRHRYVYEHYDNVDVDCAALFVVIILHNFAADLRNFCIFATSFCTQTFARAHTQRKQNMNMIMNTNTKKLDRDEDGGEVAPKPVAAATAGTGGDGSEPLLLSAKQPNTRNSNSQLASTSLPKCIGEN